MFLLSKKELIIKNPKGIMKIVVNKTLLESVVKTLSRVINSKNALPILGDILCEVSNNEMRMTASDSEVTLTATVPLETMEGEGRFCVGAGWLQAALSQLSDQAVTILATTESDMRFTLKHQSGETYFPLDDADQYPLPPETQYVETLDALRGDWLGDALKRSLWATASDDLRPIMCGVCFALTDGQLDIVASDGCVLVKSQYNINADPKRCGSIIMPRKVADILSRVVSTGDHVDIAWNATWGHIHIPFVVDITFRMVEGKYPKYNSVIPTGQPLSAIVQRGYMLNSLRKVIPFGTDNHGMHPVRLHFEDNHLDISADDYDFATGAHDRLAIEYPHDEPLSIALGGSRLVTIFSKLDGIEMVIKLVDQSRAVVIEPAEQQEDFSVLMLTMPVLLDD